MTTSGVGPGPSKPLSGVSCESCVLGALQLRGAGVLGVLGVAANGRTHCRLLAGVPGAPRDGVTSHAWNSVRFAAGVDGTLLPWLQWSDAGEAGGSGPPPGGSGRFSPMLEPKWLRMYVCMYVCN